MPKSWGGWVDVIFLNPFTLQRRLRWQMCRIDMARTKLIWILGLCQSFIQHKAVNTFSTQANPAWTRPCLRWNLKWIILQKRIWHPWCFETSHCLRKLIYPPTESKRAHSSRSFSPGCRHAGDRSKVYPRLKLPFRSKWIERESPRIPSDLGVATVTLLSRKASNIPIDSKRFILPIHYLLSPKTSWRLLSWRFELVL